MSDKKPNPPVRHHFVPESYLAAFSRTDRKGGPIWIFDHQELKTNEHNTGSVAVKRHLYSVGRNPDEVRLVEDQLAKIEASHLEVIRKIRRDNRIPSGHDYDLLIDMIALLRLRTPRARKPIIRAQKEIDSRLASILADNPDTLEHYKARMIADGYSGIEQLTSQDFRDAIASGDVPSTLENASLVQMTLEGVQAIYPHLHERRWWLYTAGVGQGDFITSDSPVTIHWTIPNAPFFEPGLALDKTEVTFPLTSRIALVGSFGDQNRTIIADKEIVSAINSRTMYGRDRFTFSPYRDFLWRTRANVVSASADDLLTQWRQIGSVRSEAEDIAPTKVRKL